MHTRPLSLVFAWLVASVALAQAPLVQNGGFETVRPVPLAADGLHNGWKLGDPPLSPSKWVMNSTYVGNLAVVTADAHEGKQFVRIGSPANNSAHLYQPIAGLKLNQWYRVSLWARGAPFEMCFYQYFTGKPMNAPNVAMVKQASATWRRYVTYYQLRGEAPANA